MLLGELSSLRPAMLELDAARLRIAELEARVVELSVSKPPDDLRRIKGIGPKFEQALRAVGVSTYAQIAAWTSADLADIAQKIGARVDRLEREEWGRQGARVARLCVNRARRVGTASAWAYLDGSQAEGHV